MSDENNDSNAKSKANSLSKSLASGTRRQRNHMKIQEAPNGILGSTYNTYAHSKRKIDIDTIKMLPSYIKSVSNSIKKIEEIISSKPNEERKKKTRNDIPQKIHVKRANALQATPTKTQPVNEFSVIEEKDEEAATYSKQFSKTLQQTGKKLSPNFKKSVVPLTTGSTYCTTLSSINESNPQDDAQPVVEQLNIKRAILESSQVFMQKNLMKRKQECGVNNEGKKEIIDIHKKASKSGDDLEDATHKITTIHNHHQVMKKKSKKKFIIINTSGKKQKQMKTGNNKATKSKQNLRREIKKNKSNLIKINRNPTLKRKTATVKCCCKCHVRSAESQPHFPLNYSKTKTPTAFKFLNDDEGTLPANSAIIPNLPQLKPIGITTPRITKLHELKDLNINSYSELMLILNEINLLKNNYITPSEKPSQPLLDFSMAMKQFLESHVDNEEEISDPDGIYKMSISAYSSLNSSLLNLSFERKRSELNKRRDEMKVRKIIVIQRKWREYKVRKMLRSVIGADLKFKDITAQSFLLLQQKDILKLCKLNLYSNLVYCSEQFRNILSLMSHAMTLWDDLQKNSLFTTTKMNLIGDFKEQSNPILISRLKFQEMLSKMITNEIKLKSSSINANNSSALLDS